MRRLSLAVVLLLVGCPLIDPAPVDEDRDGVALPDDCDDNDPAVHPGAPELCDGLDNDCDLAADEGWDEDADGYKSCGASPDCDDTNQAVHPGAVEVCDGIDNDCNGTVDDGGSVDADDDGFCSGADCDDTDPLIHPDAIEICDGVDNNCSGVADDDLDEDGDGFPGCGGTDCDDGDDAVHPGATEVCDGDDENCDGAIDEGFDADADGVTTCAADPDCDDTDPAVYPGAIELCNDADDDCDGDVDEGATEDLDGDGVGGCEGDCDDSDPAVYPGAPEVPNGQDDDCDGDIDETLVGSIPITTFAPTVSGTETQEHLGQWLSTSGDFNGDGLADFASGSGSFDLGTGRVHLVLGTAYDAASPPATVAVHATIDGDAEGVYLGERVDLGDINGDGFADLIVGKPMFNSVAVPAGAVHVWFGEANPPSGVWTLGSADLVIEGEQAAEQCGTAVAALGDVNGDGVGDLGFTCGWYSEAAGPFQGRLAVFFGRSAWSAGLTAADADATVVGEAADDGLGQALAGDFDFNGDGVMDVALGSAGWNGGAGRVALWLGGSNAWSVGGSVSAADAIWSGGTDHVLGQRITAGNADSDIYGDLMLGSPDAFGTRGNVFVVYGASSPVSGNSLSASTWWFTGSVATEEAGSSSALWDFDGDGLQDFAVGVPGWDGAAGDMGRMHVHYGDLGGLSGAVAASSADLYIRGPSEGDFLGGSMTVLQDFNGDGAVDIAVSAPFAGSQATGFVTIVPGG